MSKLSYKLPSGLASVSNVAMSDLMNQGATPVLPNSRNELETALMESWRHYQVPDETLIYLLETTLCDLARGATYDIHFVED